MPTKLARIRVTDSILLITLLLVAGGLTAGCGQEDKKKAVNELCTAENDCADNICHRGICVSKSPAANGATCIGNGFCKSLNCNVSSCAPGKSLQGVKCIHNEECESSVCSAGLCAKTSGQLDGGFPDAKAPDLGVADLTPPDAPLPDVSAPDQALPDKAISDAPIPDQLLPDQMLPDAPIPDQLIPDAPIPDLLIPDAPIPDLLIPDQLIPDQPIPDIGLDSAPWDAGAVTTKDPNGIAITKDTTHPYKRQVAVTYNSGTGHYATVWWHTTISAGYIAGARIDTNGKLLDTTPVTVYGGGGKKPSIASDGTNYLLVWENGYAIWGSRLDKNLASLDGPFGFQISASTGQGSPVVRFDGTN
jgi:hypothetical protein